MFSLGVPPRQLTSAGASTLAPLTSFGSVQHSDSTLHSTPRSLPDTIPSAAGYMQVRPRVSPFLCGGLLG
jgi:hypothetical protein